MTTTHRGNHLRPVTGGLVEPMHDLPDDVADALRRCSLAPGLFAARIHWYSEVASTNDVAAALADAGAAEGTVVAADAQSAGRGRLGRQWASPRGAGLYVSFVLRPGADVARLVTIAAGVAVCEGVRAATGLMPDVKWPNDALVAGRKVAGILAEAGAADGALQHVVLGVGINVGQAAYPPDIASIATSLEAELGRSVDRGLVFAEVLSAFAHRYAELQQGRKAAVIEAWRHLARVTLGRKVEWESAAGSRQGVARDIDETGALVVDVADGATRVIAGAVRWV